MHFNLIIELENRCEDDSELEKVRGKLKIKAQALKEL